MPAISGTDLAILTSRLGCARLGASRLGFYPDDVEGTGASEPGEYIWKETEPIVTAWTLVFESSVCGKRPVAAFTDIPDPSLEGESVQFTDASTPAADITYWAWDFGDGSAVSYDQNPTHTYSTAGSYTVTLLVSSANGSDSVTGTHTVTALDTIVEGTVTFDYGGGPVPVVGEVVELRDGADVVQDTTVTDANGLYRFTNPVVTMLDGEGFEIYVYSTDPAYVDTFDESHLWAVGVTTVVDIAMSGV